ncbi:M16 family metallopeptidase [Melioribacter sp. OK-6-Me]|uniref:M16 family metallopeptidase n=1 Tax=unclassified Melioribacter TaxID=2627329 RepID=UPI003ED8E4C4
MKNLTSIFVMILIALNLNAQKADRSKPPQLPPPKGLQLPAVQEFTLQNGLKVYLMEKHQVPLIQLNLILRTGSLNDPDGKEGLSDIVFDMLDEGADGMNALQIADEIDFLGANLNISSSLFTSNLNLNVPVSKINDALEIFSKILLKPDFPEAELSRLKKERLTTLMQWHDQPNEIARVAFNKLLFGNHPYGRNEVGTEKSIKNITRDDIIDYYKKYFTPDNSFIVTVGDIDRSGLEKLLNEYFSSWNKKGDFKQKIEMPLNGNPGKIFLIDKPGAAQSVIYIGDVAPSRTTQDYYSINVMNTILGGSFTSRLNNNLREEHGYTYGAGSRFVLRPVAGYFIAYSSVQTDVTDKALREFFKELNGIRQPISQEEVDRAKNYTALGYPNNFQTVAGIAGELEELVYYNLPKDYFNQYIDRILSVKDKEVKSAAEKYIRPDKMIVVVVGDKSRIAEGIKKLNLGEVIEMTVEDVLGKVPEL